MNYPFLCLSTQHLQESVWHQLVLGRREFLIFTGKFQLIVSLWGKQIIQYKRRQRMIKAVSHDNVAWLFMDTFCRMLSLIHTGDFSARNRREITERVKTEIAENRMISRREIAEKSYEIGCIAEKSYDLRNHSMLWFLRSYEKSARYRREITNVN